MTYLIKKHPKGIVFFEVKIIILVVIFIFLLFYMILSYNIKQSAVKDEKDIENMLYTRYAFKKFLTDERCLGVKHFTGGIILLNKLKIDSLESYSNLRLPCFAGDSRNYEIKIKNVEVSYKHLPKFVLLNKIIFLLDYSLTSQVPLDDDTDMSAEDAIVDNTLDLLDSLDSLLYSLKEEYPFMDFDVHIEVDAFSHTYEDEIYKIYPYGKFDKLKVAKAIQDYAANTIPQGGSSIVDPLIKVTQGIENATVIIVSDMKFNYYPDNSFLEKLKRRNVVLHVIMINSSRTKPYIIKKAVEDYRGKITYCDMYVDPLEGIYKIGYTYRYVLFYNPYANTYIPSIYNVECLDPLDITENVNKLGIYKKIGNLRTTNQDYKEKAKHLASYTNGIFLEVKNQDDLLNAFERLFKNIEDKSKEIASNAIKEKRIINTPYYVHIGVENNTPAEWGGKEEVYVVPVVLTDERGMGEFGFIKFMAHSGEFERFYALIYDLCNLQEDYAFVIRKEFSFPKDVVFKENHVCLGNDVCKRLTCKKDLVTPSQLKAKSDLEFEITDDVLKVRVL